MYIPSTGGAATIPIHLDSLTGSIAGFRLCLAENARAYSFVGVEPGEFMTQCGWEYLNWRRTPIPENLYSHNMTGLIEIMGIASVTDSYVPTCYSGGESLELIRIKTIFAPPNWATGANQGCTASPLMFFWRDCYDNVLFSQGFDSVHAVNLLTANMAGYFETIDLPFPGFGPPKNACDTSASTFLSTMTATNGVYDLICTDSTNPWLGDLNCDGYPHTIADVVTYLRYFLWGLGSFTCSIEASIAGSDINQDGLTLTVADAVLLIRYSIGDGFILDWPTFYTWFPKPAEQPAQIEVRQDGSCALEIDQPVAACYLKLLSNSDLPIRQSDLRDLSGQTMVGSIGDTITLLWINQTGEPVFGMGRHSLFATRDSRYQIVHTEIVDMDARPMAVTISQSLPTEFRLEQNVPNPFNPTTDIAYYLQSPGNVTLAVYNIYGQQVIRLVDEYQSAGTHVVTWHAVDQAGDEIASGLYFYRLETNGNVATKKMLLLK